MSKLRTIYKTVLLSYGVLAFTAHPIPAALILLASFFHPVVGLMGLAGNAISNIVALWMHANKAAWKAGVFGVSGILIGLALGMYAETSFRMWVFLVIGSAFSGVIAVMLGDFLAKYDLPILSVPFMMVIWVLLLTLGVSKGEISQFPAIPILENFDLWLFNLLPIELFEFIKLFGSILFQKNLISGVLVLIAITLFSRISLLYGVWGGVLGMITYVFLHGSLDGFDGLNYFLTALAFGGFFIVTNRHGFAFASLAIIATGLVDIATQTVLISLSSGSNVELPSLVFAFNIVTLISLFPIKMLPIATRSFRLTSIPLSFIKSPEANLRWYNRWSGQRNRHRTIITFPYIGEWSVLQGNNGEWTHKGVGRFAWDFVVRDGQDHQANGIGLEVEDYYSYGLPVLAPAPGTIYSIENGVVDNPPQTANMERNWGNYIIIDHGNGEFSELSHFKQGSIVVYPGQHVDRGQLLGQCGNSGRSPVPHIHYQLQTSPLVGASSLPILFSEGILNGGIKINFIPVEDNKVANLEIEAEGNWSLLGKESESFVYDCQLDFFRFKETLTFSTDEYGFPAIISNRNFLWRIIDKPNFMEIIPDFKTYPSLLSPSAWMEIVGEMLVLPKILKQDLTWNGGNVMRDEYYWRVETNEKLIVIDPTIGIINVRIPDKSRFKFELVDHIRKKM